jgi:hypothetical protein
VSAMQRVNLMLRVVLEVGVVAAFAVWGVHAGHGAGTKVLLGIGAPVIGFGFWGAVDFHRARHGEIMRLIQELIVSGVAAGALYAAGARSLGILLGALTIVYHTLVYASGARLLKPAQTRVAASGVFVGR